MATMSACVVSARPFCAASNRIQSAPRPVAAVRPFLGASKPALPLCSGFSRPTAGRRAAIVAASNDIELQGLNEGDGAPGSEYTPVFALAAFAASYFEQFTVNLPVLLKAFAVYALINAASAIVFNEGNYDKIGTVVAPGVLAAGVVLKQLDTFNVVIGLFGWYLARELKGLPFWGWIATLVAALYFDYGTYWVVGAYAFGTLTRVLEGLENNKVPVISIPILAVSAFAVMKEYKSLWVVSLALGEVFRSFYRLINSVKDKEPKGLKEHS